MIAPWGEETRRAQPTALARWLRRCDKGARRWILGPTGNVARIDACVEKALGATLAQRVARVVGGVAADSRDCGTQALDGEGTQDGAVAGVGNSGSLVSVSTRFGAGSRKSSTSARCAEVVRLLCGTLTEMPWCSLSVLLRCRKMRDSATPSSSTTE